MSMLYALALIYSTLITFVLTLTTLISARSIWQAAMSLLFLPLLIYFIRRLYALYLHFLKTKSSAPDNHAFSPPSSSLASTEYEGEVVNNLEVNDINRRLFLKLIGSAGLATFVFALFKHDAQAAFFGSVPGPGTVALKDSNDRKIDPAEKGPTDGYEISQVDDNTIPSYYGFMNKEGNWYIAREGNGGEYRYIRGNTDFATSWSARTSLVYDYFNNVF